MIPGHKEYDVEQPSRNMPLDETHEFTNHMSSSLQLPKVQDPFTSEDTHSKPIISKTTEDGLVFVKKSAFQKKKEEMTDKAITITF